MAVLALRRFADKAERVASGLYIFRDSLRGSSTRITAIIGELFTISSILRGLDHAQDDRINQPSFYRIEDDLHLFIKSLRSTLNNVLDMFARSQDRPYQVVWDDLNHHMDEQEGRSFLRRLEMYTSFLKAQSDILCGIYPGDIEYQQQRILDLWENQQIAYNRPRGGSMSDSSMWNILEMCSHV